MDLEEGEGRRNCNTNWHLGEGLRHVTRVHRLILHDSRQDLHNGLSNAPPPLLPSSTRIGNLCESAVRAGKGYARASSLLVALLSRPRVDVSPHWRGTQQPSFAFLRRAACQHAHREDVAGF